MNLDDLRTYLDRPQQEKDAAWEAAVEADPRQTGEPPPAWVMLDYLGEYEGPIYHCTSGRAANAIAKRGFTSGEPELDRLAVTRGGDRSTRGKARAHVQPPTGPGFNFGYDSEGLYDALSGLRAPGCPYGGIILRFRGPGIRVYNRGDQEEQIIFWGPDANTSRMRRDRVQSWQEVIAMQTYLEAEIKRAKRKAKGRKTNQSDNPLKARLLR